MKEYNIFGYKWLCRMEGESEIHPGKSHWYYEEDAVKQTGNNSVELTTLYKPGTEIHHWDGNIYYPTYGSGIIRSVDEFTYGTFLADIMLPRGLHLWPSFWLTGSKFWPPEIDIFEAYSDKKKGKYTEGLHWNIKHNIHYQTDTSSHEWIHAKGIPYFSLMNKPTKNYNNYKLEWTPNSIKFLVNNHVIRDIDYHDDPEVINGLNRSPYMYMVFSMEIKKDYTKHELDTLSQPMKIKNFKYIPYFKERTGSSITGTRTSTDDESTGRTIVTGTSRTDNMTTSGTRTTNGEVTR